MEAATNNGATLSNERENGTAWCSNGDSKSTFEISNDEVTDILKVIASTGKFWLEWGKLKNVLLFQLKQVLADYPEAKMTIKEQIDCLGETYLGLVARLNEGITSFEEGPPFTLQRLCEILLAAKNIYPKLSNLALALEKNLLVTSMLAICSEPYPTAINKEPDGEKGGENQQEQKTKLVPDEENDKREERDEVTMTDYVAEEEANVAAARAAAMPVVDTETATTTSE